MLLVILCIRNMLYFFFDCIGGIYNKKEIKL